MAEFLRLKKSNCKNCYKCIRHCPVKSIRISANQAHIVPEECILCGQCFVVCPQGAKEIADNTEKAEVLLNSGKVIASLAPSFTANYDGAGIEAMEKALKQLGFYAAEETAIGATIVKKEYDRLLQEGEQDVIISSCCHSINLLIEKYFPSALRYLAKVVSPMQAHCMDIKKRYPDAKTIFIGPCVSKKDEADRYPGPVDCVLTFEELSSLMRKRGVSLERTREDNSKGRARLFPTTGGILKSMFLPRKDYSYLALDGTEDCIAALREIEKGNLRNCFIEMSACRGSCVGGPVMEKYHCSPVSNYNQVASYAKSEDFDVAPVSPEEIYREHDFIGTSRAMPTQSEIEAILKKIGKLKPEDELNCGSCGYNTCREKAIAVYQGKADLNMCLPYLKDKAESFSDNIISNTPNGIIVLNEDFEVQQINAAARDIMNIRSAGDVLGEQVVRILDPKDFLEVKQSGTSIRDRRVYLAEYRKYVEETILYDKEYKIIICIMRDITDIENEKEKKEAISRATIETADKVVDKQMRVVQEIASLLGETAAETKIALAKLKESISDE
ncbi:MAG: 4Fe-4S binding protein [Christensenellaceae bacterium]|jgi:iron only hydrogenase large subunit, C-terminal domain|nr:4Fe-4S binding protein [Christensenellaceae bacterium]MBS6564342.1 4Fe-4S binding protein [Clostridiales bacterium]PWL99920.1 MAG: histidine kinase [Selenomonadales bacterium]